MESEPNPASDVPAIDWRRLHAFGWPAGSVRALLAILIFGTALGLLALRPTLEVPDYLRDLLFIIMGHYFASRHRAATVDEPGPSPLYLPRGTVRFLLIAGGLGVGGLLYSRGQLTTPGQHPGVVTFWLVGGFLLGVALNWLWGQILGRDRRSPRFVEDTRALISMVAALALVALVWNRLYVVVPSEEIDRVIAPVFGAAGFRLEHALAAVVGFYFGSRS